MNPLDIDKQQVLNQYETPEEYCDAIVQHQKNELESGTEIELSEEQKEALYEIIRDSVRDDLWDDTSQ
jgi:hypothetical protein